MIDSSNSSHNSAGPADRPDEHLAPGQSGHAEHQPHENDSQPHEHKHQHEAGHDHQHRHEHSGEHGHVHEPHHDDHGHQPEHPPHVHEVVIQIDRTPYKEVARDVSGAEIRRIPTPHIPADRDLFEVVPGAPDRKVLDDTIIHLREGQRFFTAPGQINPGCSKSNR